MSNLGHTIDIKSAREPVVVFPRLNLFEPLTWPIIKEER